jgi:pyruvate/2-oxoglutarate/acetoin dehydrogenase E1 component
VTIRGIINRGGEQGAQHSQALHALFAHIPGLRVVMPATPQDARDLLIASVLCDDPVLYIDDRWLYDLQEELPEPTELCLAKEGPQCLLQGSDLTLVAAGFSVQLCIKVASLLKQQQINAEVIDLRIINPLDPRLVIESVVKTKRFCVIDGGWSNCGLAGEVIATVVEHISLQELLMKPLRITLPNSPAPTSKTLEQVYYPNAESIAKKLMQQFAGCDDSDVKRGSAETLAWY